MSLPIVKLIRKETFSACHRLNSSYLSEDANKQVFGRCNNINGHGHNYTVEVTIKGTVDIKTGMVMNLHDLKQVINSAVMEPLDHKNLDLDVPYFKNTPSTTENLAVFIWDSMKSKLDNPALLHEIKLYETEKNFVKYRGKMTNGSSRVMDRRQSQNANCNNCNISSDSD